MGFMKLKKNISIMLVIGLMSSTLIGCSNTSSDAGKSVDKENARKANNELIAAVTSEPETGFDATDTGHGDMTSVFFSTLFKRNKNLGIENDLAKSYEISEDRLTWTVKIREDVKFTDGENLTAEDVVYTYEIAKNSGSSIDLTMLDSVSKVDDYTVEFKLKNPQSTFIEKLATVGIVPKHAHNEGFSDNPIGSGPYKLVQWDKGQQVIAKENENYYGDKPKIKQLTMVFLDTDAAYSAVQTGDVDVCQINGNLADKKVDGANVVDIESIECYGVEFPMVKAGEKAKDGYDMGNNVTSDEAIRKALNTAVDRQKIVDGVLNGYGTPSTTGLEQMPWEDKSTELSKDEYANVDEAKKILSDGGWKDTDNDGVLEKDGQKAEFKLLYTEGEYRQEMALEFVNVAKEIGISVNLEVRTWDTILEEIHKEAVLFGFGSGDPSELYNLYYGPIAGGTVAWDNAGGYNNEKVNEDIDKALDAKDEDEALPYWKDLQKYTSAKGDAPYCWLVNANHVYLAADGFDFGNPVVQPHGGRIFDNVNEWSWK